MEGSLQPPKAEAQRQGRGVCSAQGDADERGSDARRDLPHKAEWKDTKVLASS